eukprot:CAMPEP_0181104124 /NCGR_PEP_ID=MMETSP1071-20121207/15250_1 /TAXON_ID=35127 /ORGANISM="Thalassiosira sp., Strain NH16" /LENGTH=150 /DNA_ID=CAMNT_0023187281 /DNA_START=58 /DNA_END=509 /DNA_ORIENTATION=-
MRSRLLNQVPKALRTSGRSSGAGRGRSSPISQSSPSSTIRIQSRQRHALQQRLFSTSNVRITRTALGVEACSSALALIEGIEAEPNLPRGWDAGIAVDDDGGIAVVGTESKEGGLKHDMELGRKLSNEVKEDLGEFELVAAVIRHDSRSY